MAGNASVPSERERKRERETETWNTASWLNSQPLAPFSRWLWKNERCTAGTIRTSGSYGYDCQSLRLAEHLSHLSRRLIPSPLKLATMHTDLPPRTTGRRLLAHSAANKADFTAKVTVYRLPAPDPPHTHTHAHTQSGTHSHLGTQIETDLASLYS